MQRIEWEYDDGECAPFVVSIPAKWEICDECAGEGKSSAYLGAITEEDRDRDWSHDDFADYLNGGYDRSCTCCKGSGKVVMPDWNLMDFEIQAGTEIGKKYKLYQEHLEDDAAYAAECAWERRMGA